MLKTIERAKRIACEAAIEAGNLAKSKFNKVTELIDKGEDGDLVTEADFLAEEVILHHIRKAFPDHRIQSEEAGDNGLKSEWHWQIDPLDGTNNFAAGIPVFSTSITLINKNKPVLGVIYEPVVDRLYVSSLNGGTLCNDKPVFVENKNTKLTVGWIQGHAVLNEERAVKLRQHIDVNCKRMLRLWAPTIVWCMLARGDADGVILYNSEGEDLYSGILMVKEAGGIVIDFQGNEVKEISAEPYFIACHPANKEYFLNLVREGLNH
ncbi:inositol monophosphatase family protein [Cytobacillus purgationiresistens]|uniref:Myo-inositol-1(Or 4)-monophosphatase n=1 Tax=Cytobacillus purgationiresistens TaxID=863449 RepID=A0ABU0AL71_9BACI|nr:inositol monophosphatase [Cytobacillus purgationiresistens]MDQ0271639.1 myo-inositol-1(or 4)-monophosphatase [Cytobacillus purgationiresistens]